MKKNLKNKLGRYSALVSAYSVVSFSANAEEVKDTVNHTGGFETYGIDIDGDGVKDFAVHCFEWGTGGVIGNSFNVEFYGNNEMVSEGNYANVLSQSYDLTSDKNFAFLSNVSVGNSVYVRGIYGGGYQKNPGGQIYRWGEVVGKSGFYLGVRFDISGETHYGWMRFNVSTQVNSWKLIDMGYETEPNTALKINYVEPPLSLNESNNDQVEINRVGDDLAVFENQNAVSELELLDITGKTVKKENKTNSIYIGDIPKGIYFVRLTSTKGILTKKVYL